MRARFVPEREVNRGDPQPLTGRSLNTIDPQKHSAAAPRLKPFKLVQLPPHTLSGAPELCVSAGILELRTIRLP